LDTGQATAGVESSAQSRVHQLGLHGLHELPLRR
jgi:hypothetical protein